MVAIPPTRVALVQYMQRPVYQGGHCWGKAFQVSFDLPSPGNWGWTDRDNWKPGNPGSYCAVAARKGAEGCASAKEQC